MSERNGVGRQCLHVVLHIGASAMPASMPSTYGPDHISTSQNICGKPVEVRKLVVLSFHHEVPKGLNSGLQAWQQAAMPTEPSHQPVLSPDSVPPDSRLTSDLLYNS